MTVLVSRLQKLSIQSANLGPFPFVNFVTHAGNFLFDS